MGKSRVAKVLAELNNRIDRFGSSRGYPRLVFWAGVVLIIGSVTNAIDRNFWKATFNFCGGVFSLYVSYRLYKDLREEKASNPYSSVIGRVSDVMAHLSEIQNFLEKERKNIDDAQRALAQLNDENKQLEPVVSANREQVEAILTASAKRLAGNVWKERLIFFALGIVAALVASVIYDFFKGVDWRPWLHKL